MITLAAYILLALFLIGQIALLVSFPLVAFFLNSLLGFIWCYHPKK